MDTKLVCGGVYYREKHGRKYHALCVNVVVQANGLKQGTLEMYGFAPERLDEGSDELNLFTLVATPAPVSTVAPAQRKAS